MDLERYLTESGPSVSKPHLGTISYIQRSLESLNLPPIGDLYEQDNESVELTVNTLSLLIEQKSKDVAIRNELQDKIVRIEYDRNTLEQKYHQMCETKTKLTNELGNLENRMKKREGEWKKERTSLAGERDGFKRDYNKLLTKMNEISKNTKKSEQTLNRLKEQLKKAMGDSHGNYRNHVDFTEFLHINGPDLSSGAAEFGLLVGRGYQENVSKLLEENQEFRECLEAFQRQLSEIAQAKIDAYEELEPPPETLNQIKLLRHEIFRLPVTALKHAVVQTFVENIEKFGRFYAELCNELSVYLLLKSLDENVHSAADLRALIHNYKEIVFKQERQLNALRVQLQAEQTKFENKVKEVEEMSAQLKQELAKAEAAKKEYAEKERQLAIEQIRQKNLAESKPE